MILVINDVQVMLVLFAWGWEFTIISFRFGFSTFIFGNSQSNMS
jgi:hypothetical protein